MKLALLCLCVVAAHAAPRVKRTNVLDLLTGPNGPQPGQTGAQALVSVTKANHALERKMSLL